MSYSSLRLNIIILNIGINRTHHQAFLLKISNGQTGKLGAKLIVDFKFYPQFFPNFHPKKSPALHQSYPFQAHLPHFPSPSTLLPFHLCIFPHPTKAQPSNIQTTNEIIALYQFFKCFIAIQEEMSEIEESEVYSPEQSKESGRREEDQGYKRRVEKTTSNTVEGKWTDDQNTKYILFMEYHSKIFASKEKRKSTRIFKTLSELLGTRTPRQCRSHFQKIMNKFKRVNHVKLHYMNQLGADEYQRQLALLAKEIQPQIVKCDDSEKTHFIARNNVQVQTEPMSLRIQDLPNTEVLKLLHLLQEYQKAQMPFFMSRPVFPNEQPRIF